jgi:hypothetical protein
MRVLLAGVGGAGTAIAAPVVALELIDPGAWPGSGVPGPEALPAEPFLDPPAGYGSPWACEERAPAGPIITT